MRNYVNDGRGPRQRPSAKRRPRLSGEPKTTASEQKKVQQKRDVNISTTEDSADLVLRDTEPNKIHESIIRTRQLEDELHQKRLIHIDEESRKLAKFKIREYVIHFVAWVILIILALILHFIGK